ncbi:unnamed protein product [Durusdinium trenchii]|uniref:Uncharacterized protein n=1 Tax=Durusdinium trenchii TaxID=1381693 RepID=A0ABP0K3V4_9DINO
MLRLHLTANSRGHDQMFDARMAPPCSAGRGPDQNHLKCDPCGPGLYGVQGFCQACPPGSIPSEDRGTCEDCPMFHYSTSGVDQCVACSFPLALVDNHCVWWHLPLLALGLGGFVVAARLLWSVLRARRAQRIERVLEEVYEHLWDERPQIMSTYSKKLSRLGLLATELEQHLADMRALQSKRAGVSLRYLLSADFAQLAMQRTGRDDPTFMDMKSAFWLSKDPIGQDIICPRDGQAGCALVDWMPVDERREQTHYLSWTWQYSLQQVRCALDMFHNRTAGFHCYFYMCFFVNNQFRIIVQQTSSGSDNLEDVFESNLKRIGKMVAILDTWDQPVYLSRVWTVYEQYVASTIQVEVQFIMPKAAALRLRQHIASGSEGIDEVIESLSQVDSKQAKAWAVEDERKVTLALCGDGGLPIRGFSRDGCHDHVDWNSRGADISTVAGDLAGEEAASLRAPVVGRVRMQDSEPRRSRSFQLCRSCLAGNRILQSPSSVATLRPPGQPCRLSYWAPLCQKRPVNCPGDFFEF